MKLKENIAKVFEALSTAYTVFNTLAKHEIKEGRSPIPYEDYRDSMRQTLLLMDEDLVNKIFPIDDLSERQKLKETYKSGNEKERLSIIETEKHIQETFEQDEEKSNDGK